MVLSSLPTVKTAGNVIANDQYHQQQQQLQQHQRRLSTAAAQYQMQQSINKQSKTQTQQISTIKLTTTPTSLYKTIAAVTTSTTTMPASKPIVLQQNHHVIDISTENANSSSSSSSSATQTIGNAYVNGQQNGKIVLVTTEPMEIEHSRNGSTNTTATPTSNNGNDEELTSLTWLHDKNLLKGINISCASNIKHINNNHIKAVTENVTAPSIKSINACISSRNQQHSPSSGTITPTSDDLVDDSGVSEDNMTSEHSSIYNRSNRSTVSPPNNYRYTGKSTTFASSATSSYRSDADDVDMIDDDKNNNHNSINNKNSTHSAAAHQLSYNQPPPASSIIHLSPGGSTVIEYKTTTNLQQKLNILSTSNASNMVASSMMAKCNTNNSNSTNNMTNGIHQQTFTPSTPHTHFHKKYIKAMNALNGYSTENSTNSSSVVVTTTLSPTKTNSIDAKSASISTSQPATNTISVPKMHTVPMKTESSNINYETHETVIVENEYPHATITLSDNGTQHIYHSNDIDRHSDDYVTPISSPRIQQQPATPHKTSNNLVTQSPSAISLPQSTAIPTDPSNETAKPKPMNNMPYDPFIHTNNKPPLSFSSLIFLAIEDAKEKALPVKEIYAWIVQHYPYFKSAPTGWKNSVRHNLSLNKCFQKVEKAPNMGKGSLWRVEQQYKQNLIIALTRSSYHPNTAAMEKATASLKASSTTSPDSPSAKTNPGRPLDAELFPRLSKFMANMQNGNGTKPTISTNASDVTTAVNPHFYHAQGDGIVIKTTPYSDHDHDVHSIEVIDAMEAQRNVERIARDWGVDNIDDVNAATAMLALKHGPKVFAETFQSAGTPIITSVPSEDHTYSAGGNSVKRSSPSNDNSAVVNNIIIENDSSNTIQLNSNPPIINMTPMPTTNSTITITNTESVQTTQNDHNNIHIHTSNVINSRHSDNVSNGTSSDAAYESSEESQNVITPEELEARRHQEGVDAFLSFATEVSSMSSPIKRPPSADYVENHQMHHFNNNNHIFTNNNHNGIAQSYFHHGDALSPSALSRQQQSYSYLSSPSPPKKSRTRTLRTKLKRKTWLR